MMGEMIMRCFHARTVAHVLHLKSRSYSQHMALNGFYDGIIPLADSLAEAYQGDYGIIEDYPVKFQMFSDPAELVNSLSEWITKHRNDCCDADDTYLQNIVDEIMALIRSTQYKLKFLK